MYFTFSKPCWTIDVCMVNSGRLQQAKSRSTVTPAGTDGLYSAWQRKNTWVLGTHEAKRSELRVIHPPKHQWNRNEIWRLMKRAFAPFFGLASSFWPILLYGFILLAVLSLRLAPVWTLSRWSRGGIWVAAGGLLPPLTPVSFSLFSPPHAFLHLSIGICQREREVWQMTPTCFSFGGKDYNAGKAAWQTEGPSVSCFDPVHAHTVHPD